MSEGATNTSDSEVLRIVWILNGDADALEMTEEWEEQFMGLNEGSNSTQYKFVFSFFFLFHYSIDTYIHIVFVYICLLFCQFLPFFFFFFRGMTLYPTCTRQFSDVFGAEVQGDVVLVGASLMVIFAYRYFPFSYSFFIFSSFPPFFQA